MTNIFGKEGIPVRIAHKSYTLRKALSHKITERTCTRDNCPIAHAKLCLLRNAVYQITYKNCKQHYIGSTTRFIHDRVKEHLANGNSSINKHITICQNNDYKGIEVKIIVMENDPVNLRLFEAFYIRKNKPTLNSREEYIEFADLLSSALAEYFISAYPSLTMPPWAAKAWTFSILVYFTVVQGHIRFLILLTINIVLLSRDSEREMIVARSNHRLKGAFDMRNELFVV